MINSTFNPTTVSDFDKNKVSSANIGVLGTAIAGQVTPIDLTLSDDHLLTGLQVLASGSVFGDSIDLQVLMGTTVVAQFGSNVFIPADSQLKLDVDSKYPAKIPAGLTLRVVYRSTGLGDVSVAVNYKLHKVLV